ncbi:MAG: hypothetical protein RLZZ04_3223 [Cyanobacteriota bacterium]|jgi:hypothetical protein
MSTIKEELLAAIEVASDEVLAQTLLFVKKSLNTVENKSLSRGYPSSLDDFSKFLQSEGFYEDEYIDRCMAEIENK